MRRVLFETFVQNYICPWKLHIRELCGLSERSTDARWLGSLHELRSLKKAGGET
jgi:hypothetical protein